MRNLTKAVIRDALLKRLNEEPLSKITVRTICQDCGINHNTFYYYYSNIYAVIREYFDEYLADIEETYYEAEESAFFRSRDALQNSYQNAFLWRDEGMFFPEQKRLPKEYGKRGFLWQIRRISRGMQEG